MRPCHHPQSRIRHQRPNPLPRPFPVDQLQHFPLQVGPTIALRPIPQAMSDHRPAGSSAPLIKPGRMPRSRFNQLLCTSGGSMASSRLKKSHSRSLASSSASRNAAGKVQTPNPGELPTHVMRAIAATTNPALHPLQADKTITTKKSRSTSCIQIFTRSKKTVSCA
jgi:hypothetical protein